MPLTALTIPGQYVSEAVLGLLDSSKFGRDAAAVRFSAILWRLSGDDWLQEGYWFETWNPVQSRPSLNCVET